MKRQTKKTAKNKQTKISHYFEVGQNSGFYWVLRKLSLQIKANKNVPVFINFMFSVNNRKEYSGVTSSFFFQTSGNFRRQNAKKLICRKLVLSAP